MILISFECFSNGNASPLPPVLSPAACYDHVCAARQANLVTDHWRRFGFQGTSEGQLRQPTFFIGVLGALSISQNVCGYS